MQIDTLRDYVALTRSLSFNRTAKELHISQSTLSNHVMLLERELGVTLINRGTPSTLTEGGRVFLAAAQRVIDEYDKGVRECRSTLKDECSVVRIGVMPYVPCPSIVKTVLARVREFRSLNDNVTVEVMPILIEDIPSALSRGEIDCGYSCAVSVYGGTMEPTAMPSGFEEFEAVEVCDAEIGIYTSVDSPLAAMEAVPPEHLQGVPIAVRMPGTAREFVEADIGFPNQYGVAPLFDYQTADSDEAFILTKLSPQAVFIIEKETFEGSLLFGNERKWIPFKPAHYCICRMMFAKEPRNDAIVDFKNFVAKRYLEEKG